MLWVDVCEDIQFSSVFNLAIVWVIWKNLLRILALKNYLTTHRNRQRRLTNDVQLHHVHSSFEQRLPVAFDAGVLQLFVAGVLTPFRHKSIDSAFAIMFVMMLNSRFESFAELKASLGVFFAPAENLLQIVLLGALVENVACAVRMLLPRCAFRVDIKKCHHPTFGSVNVSNPPSTRQSLKFVLSFAKYSSSSVSIALAHARNISVFHTGMTY